MPPVDLTWWDGGLLPARPSGLEPGRRMGDPNGGILLIGDKGTIVAGSYGDAPRLVPESSMKKYKRPRKNMERISEGDDGHEPDSIPACKWGQPAGSNSENSA